MTGVTDQQPRPYAQGAAEYLTTGLGIPMPIDGKDPFLTGVTGGNGDITEAHVDRWLDHHGAKNLALVLDETVVAIDVDHAYTGHDGRVKHGAETVAAYEKVLGPLPPTVSSTSRHDAHPQSRIRFYRVTQTDGAALRHSIDLRADGVTISKRPDGTTKGDVEVIHHRYRYVAVWPSIHPDTGQPYQWYGPDLQPLGRLPEADFDLPDLPEKWVRYLVGRAVAKGTEAYGRASDAEVLAVLTEGDVDPELGELVRRFWSEQVDHGAGVEDESDLLGMTSRLARLAVSGRPGSRTAVELCRAGYTRAPYDEDTYRRAFDAAFAGSVSFWRRRKEEVDAFREVFAKPTIPDPASTEPVTTIQATAEHGDAPTSAPAPRSTIEESPKPATPVGTVYDPDTENEILLEIRRRVVRAEAEKRIAERDAVTVQMPRRVSLADFLDEPDEDPTWRVADVWPTGGNIVLSAPAKSGKSHLVANAVRSLADGEPFLGRYEPKPCRVTVVDDELDERTWRRWLRDQNIDNRHHVDLVPLRGRLDTFDVLDPAVRARWAEHLQGTDVLVFDCLRPALDALRLDESHDAGLFLVALDQLKAAAGISEMLVVHHAGHNPTRARGDSRILDWPDASWKILPTIDDDGNVDPSQPRDFWAYGRDVDVARIGLLYDHDTRRMTLTGTSTADAGKADLVAEVIAYVVAEPGVIQKDLVAGVRDATGAGRDAVFKAVQSAVRAGRLFTERGDNNAVTYRPLGFS